MTTIRGNVYQNQRPKYKEDVGEATAPIPTSPKAAAANTSLSVKVVYEKILYKFCQDYDQLDINGKEGLPDSP